MESMCQLRSLGQTIFPEFMNATAALAHCQKVKGRIVVLDSEVTAIESQALMNISAKCIDYGRFSGCPTGLVHYMWAQELMIP
jgi:hypothetical protein